MNQISRVENKLFLDGSELEQLARDAGFVDVDVKVIKCEIGDWGPGFKRKQFPLR